MVEADLTRIEAALGLTLPGGYREYALRYVEEDARIVDDVFDQFDEPTSSPYTTADELIKANARFRNGTMYWGVGGKKQPFPAERILVIGENGGGNYCFIYTDGSDKGFWWWDHETLAIKQYHPTLTDFHQSVVDLLNFHEEQERRYPSR